ncbi:rod shape-determining protein MreD [Pseudomarimonas salicorniae]|uniref:Rod shape-determining protein MreD n=1 Tax=Pseudomarimonas salicorniae TaxID=2933270 RepID=A0ABT0GC21_9GAMM|nr:rod shape-determining protein MreD [Lysobacter sp. CAU 1642]MCK7592083.1 rod shape-determining protein MreD [Lysobacter sp. CAU 1642]
MSRPRSGPLLFLGALIAALLLGLVPFPDPLDGFKPYWIGLLVIYMALEAPERLGLGVAFLVGLAADIVYGTLLGEQALRLCILAFLVLRFRARLRFFPLSQQALAVLVLLANDRVVVLAVRVASGEGVPRADFWISPVVGMLLWPWVFLLLDQLRLRARHRDV